MSEPTPNSVMVVVEDDPDVRHIIRFILSQDARLVLSGEAATAKEAIEIAKQSQPGVIVLDHLIDGDVMGLQAAPMLKAVAPGARIILFTALDLQEEAEVEPAVDVFLLKINMHDLLGAVQALLDLPPL